MARSVYSWRCSKEPELPALPMLPVPVPVPVPVPAEGIGEFAEVNGACMFYEARGNGPAMLLLHGYRTACNFTAIAHLRLSRLMSRPAHPFAAATTGR